MPAANRRGVWLLCPVLGVIELRGTQRLITREVTGSGGELGLESRQLASQRAMGFLEWERLEVDSGSGLLALQGQEYIWFTEGFLSHSTIRMSEPWGPGCSCPGPADDL